MYRTPLAIVLATAFSPLADADVVHRTDGEVLLGTIRPGSDFAPVVIETVDGPVEVPRAEVLTVEDARRLTRSLGAARARLGADDVAGRLRLVDWALRKGLFADALDLADEALGMGGADGEVMLPAGLLEVPVHEVHRNEPLGGRRATTLLRAAADEARPATARVAQARLGHAPAAPGLTELLVETLEDRRSSRRAAALTALGVRRPAPAIPAILERMLRDGDPVVRAAAIDALRDVQDERVAPAIVQALRKDDPGLREAAMDAAEALHVVRAVGQLVRNLRRAGPSPAPSGFTAVTTQRSFVQDFDVDVANSAFIANPNIGVLQSGVVLNSRVLDTTSSPRRGGLRPREAARIGGLLSQLTGQEFGVDQARWIEWLEAQRQ